ncbi:MAG: SLC13 family permease [Planctomycetota bacterium]
MPDLPIMLVLAVAATAVVLFVAGKRRFDVVALVVLSGLLALRLLRPDQALYGFASQATATVAAMFVLSAALVRTGLVQWLARHIDRLAGRTESRLILVLCLSIAALSAFVVNTATVAIFIPVATVLARTRGVSASRVLMPLSFASQFGGVCTLIGTSTNILVGALAVTYGLEPFGLFEFAPLGLVMCAAGVAYLMIAAPRLLPARKEGAQQVDKYRLADYLAELRVKEKSPLVGATWRHGIPPAERPAELIKLVRGESATWRPSDTPIQAGDVLVLHGDVQKIIEMQDKFGLEIEPDVTVGDENLSSDRIKLVEVVIPPRSSLAGRTLRSSAFARRFGCPVLAIQRRGRILRERLSDIRLDAGDTLLLQCDEDDLEGILRTSDLIATNELTDLYVRKDRAVVALPVFVAALALVALKIVPIHVAAIIAAVAVIVGRCLTIEEAYRAIDWKVIFLLGGIIPLGLAMEQTGAARWLADRAMAPFADHGPLVVLAVLYITTAVLTEFMSNTAAAVLLAPIALSLAGVMEVSPRPFLVAITFAASTSFATPIGYQTNTMVFAPGGYRFTDYTRVGAPLNLVFWALAVWLIPLLWPF